MELFFLKEPVGPDGLVVISGQEANHLARVLRHRSGDRVLATDGKGKEYELELLTVKPTRVTGRVRATRERERESGVRLVLAQSIIKGERMAELVDSVTQLGVSEIVPVRSARTVARLSQAKLEHLRRKMVEAVKCSLRSVLPPLADPVELSELLQRTPEFEATVVAYEEETEAGLTDVLNPQVKSVLLLIGPEGGFEPEEIARMQTAGMQSFSLGPRRLRAETAATAAVALVLSHLGQLGGQRRGDEERPHTFRSGAEKPTILTGGEVFTERRC